MRVLIELPGETPLFGAFATVPEVREDIKRYQALDQRLRVVGAAFDEGNDWAPQMDLTRLGHEMDLLTEVGIRLLEVGKLATGQPFSPKIQHDNARNLAQVATERNLEIDARRLFVKTWVNLLELQRIAGERQIPKEELHQRYQGAFDDLRGSDAAEEQP
jgi:hypothetical protein